MFSFVNIKRIQIIMILVSILIPRLHAEDVYTKDGKIYQNVLINKLASTERSLCFWFNSQTTRIPRNEVSKIDSSKEYNADLPSEIHYLDSKIEEKVNQHLLEDEQNIGDVFYNDFTYFGYCGNLITVPFGFTFGRTNLSGSGFYFSLKMGGEGVSEDELYTNISKNKADNIYGDSKNGKRNRYWAVDLGLTSRLSNRLFIYYGIGYSLHQEYVGYKDEFEILGKNGNYFIEGNKTSGININFGGAYFIENGWYFSLGANLTPSGAEIGVGKTL